MRVCSNNTNKLSPQEPIELANVRKRGSNNTNKLSPQELIDKPVDSFQVQIIQINLVLKNLLMFKPHFLYVQIIQINLVLKNPSRH